MKTTFDWFISEESGQGMVEYGLIIALIAVVLITALGEMRGGLESIFEKITNILKNPGSAGESGGG